MVPTVPSHLRLLPTARCPKYKWYKGAVSPLDSQPPASNPKPNHTTTTMKFTSLYPLAFACLTIAAPTENSSLDKRGDMCYFTGGGPIGIPQAVCAGSNGNAHTDVLWCPSAGVADRICGSDDVNPLIRDNCKRIDGTGSYCTAGGTINEEYPGNAPCWYVPNSNPNPTITKQNLGA